MPEEKETKEVKLEATAGVLVAKNNEAAAIFVLQTDESGPGITNLFCRTFPTRFHGMDRERFIVEDGRIVFEKEKKIGEADKGVSFILNITPEQENALGSLKSRKYSKTRFFATKVTHNGKEGFMLVNMDHIVTTYLHGLPKI